MRWKFSPNQTVYVAEVDNEEFYRLKISGASVREEDGKAKIFYSFSNGRFDDLPEESIMTPDEFLEYVKKLVDEDSKETLSE